MKTVMCFGVFDRFHPGHLSYLKQARKYGDQLIVIIARDKTVLKVKGRRPQQNEIARRLAVKRSGCAEKVELGQLRDKFAVVKKYQPDIICLGYDQQVDEPALRKYFLGRIIRLKPYKEKIYKSSKMAQK
ncbi:MAG: adenylyltransferase/cytidyltransferase family protein [Patescibacteria group bacterium]|jgi:FAD synthetase